MQNEPSGIEPEAVDLFCSDLASASEEHAQAIAPKQSSVPRSRIGMPSLPVEVIERIIKYTFAGRSSPLTPSSDHYPLAGTTPVLLVSHAIRELALPHFLRSITITRPQDYVTFFGKGTGLFEGKRGANLWDLVEEVSVVKDVFPPLRQPFDRSAWPLLHPLGPVPKGRVQHFCILDCKPARVGGEETGSTSWVDQPGGEELLAARIRDPLYRKRARTQLDHQERKLGPRPDPQPSAIEWDKMIDSQVKTGLGNTLSLQHQASFADFTSAVNPQTFHTSWPVEPTKRDRGQDPFQGGPAAKTLIIYQQPGFVTDKRHGRLNQFARGSGYPHIHVVGFATEVIEILTMVFRVCANRTPEKAKMLRWEKDGQLVEYNPVDRTTTRVESE